MKRIFLTAAGLFALLHSFSQKAQDSTGFKSRKLKIEEVNFISSYYSQDGNNAAVTGGIGTQKLTDIVNITDIKLVKYDRKLRKHSFDIEVGMDSYTSASSDQVDLKANSSASYKDNRYYPSVNWSVENETKGTAFGIGASVSTEYDYFSLGGNAFFSKKTKNRNGEFTAKVHTYFDRLSLIAPEELRGIPGVQNGGSAARNTFSGSLSWSQIINERLQLMFIADIVQQNGYLSLPFHRVYFNDASVHQEKLPGSRFKIPLGFRANYFLGDKVIIKTFYRFYTDDWGLSSHTINLEMPVKITPFLSISPYYRFYDQTAIKYFAPWQKHSAADQYYTSNYDLSRFSSHFFGAGFRIIPPKGVFGLDRFNMLELRYGHYAKNIDMNSDIISLHLKFKKP
jgi:Protein of unknown function (DUF3570)